MIESNAISPKIKELYDKVNKNAEIFITISEQLQNQLSNLNKDRDNLKRVELETLTEIEKSSTTLKNTINEALSELNASTEKALKLHNELSSIQNLKDTLFSLQQKLTNQSKDINKTMEDIKFKTENELKELAKTIDYRLETDLEKESQKIDARISLKVKQIENKVSTYDQRMYTLNQTQVSDSKTAIKEIDRLKKDFGDLKRLLDESQQNLLDDFENFEGEFRKKLYNYELRFKDISKKLNNYSPDEKPEPINKDEIMVGGKPKQEVNFDKNIFEKEYKKINSLVGEYSDLKESLVDTSSAADKKANLALLLSSISLVGIVLILILYSI
jgi:hypothetical protein